MVRNIITHTTSAIHKPIQLAHISLAALALLIIAFPTLPTLPASAAGPQPQTPGDVLSASSIQAGISSGDATSQQQQVDQPDAVCPPGGQCFTDVLSSNPFYNFINRSYMQDIVSGYACGGAGEPCDSQHRPYYRPANNVTRQQMAKFIDNSRHLPGTYIQTNWPVAAIYISNTSTVAGASGIYAECRSCPGVWGVSTGGVGVRGISGSGNGVYGGSTSSNGVYGGSTSSYGVQGNSISGVGVYGSSTSSAGVRGSSANYYGVWGSSTSSTFSGVWGSSTSSNGVLGTSTSSNGVLGTSTSGNGVRGTSTSSVGVRGASDSNYGVEGLSTSNVGVRGSSTSNAGVRGYSDSGDGVWGSTGSGNGVYGYTAAASGNWAGFFAGNVAVTGSCCQASAGSYRIDDPTDPANKYLYQSAVESPDMMDIYNGNVTTDANGDATVHLPDWFQALNRDFRYQLTPVGQFAQAMISQEIHDSQFSIKTDKPNVKVSWQVTGIRQDPYANAHRVPVQEDKPAGEQGTYLHPAEYGQPASKGIDYDERQQREQIRP